MRTTGRTKGGRKRPAHLIRIIVATVGYILSPLSPWNDAFVNVPLSILIAYILSSLMNNLISFEEAYWVSYILTNLIGILMIYLASREYLKKFRWSQVIESLLIALMMYSVLFIVFHSK